MNSHPLPPGGVLRLVHAGPGIALTTGDNPLSPLTTRKALLHHIGPSVLLRSLLKVSQVARLQELPAYLLILLGRQTATFVEQSGPDQNDQFCGAGALRPAAEQGTDDG